MRNNKGNWWAALLLGVLLFGCDKEELGKNEGSPQRTAPKSAPSHQVAAPSQAKPIATKEQVNAFITEWLTVQNNGDFAAYSEFYAQKFQGTKRVGERSKDFDRKGWLEDRKGMFKKPFSVKSTDVHVHFLPASVIVGFQQSWKSATFQDKGEKRLQLQLEGGKLRINREAMVTSDQSSIGARATLVFEQGAITERTSNYYALLIPGTVNINWATEHPVYIHDELGERAVSEKSLPAELRELRTFEYEIYDAGGTRCVARPSGFKISISVSPNYSTLAMWQGLEGYGDDTGPLPNADRALGLWSIASSSGLFTEEGVPMGLTLALELERAASCPNPIWGRKLREGLEKEWSVRAASPKELSQMIAAAPRHPLSKTEARATPETLEQAKKSKTSAKVIESRAGEMYFVLDLWSQDEVCGGYEVSLSWRKHAGSLVPNEYGHFGAAETLDVADLNGDGQPDFIGRYAIGTQGTGRSQVLVSHHPPMLGCRC